MPPLAPLPQPPAPDVLERREFCACALALTALACGGGGASGGTTTPSPPPPPPSPVTTTDTKSGLLAQPNGTIRDYTTSAAGACPGSTGSPQGYYLVRDGGGIYAFSASCLHLGGRIVSSGSGFSCPCHGSGYDLNGTVTVGPAPVGAVLQHYQVTESTPGGVLVITPSSPVSASTRLT